MSAQSRNLKAIEGVKSLEAQVTRHVVAPGTLAEEWKAPETLEARAAQSLGLDEIFARLWRRKLVLLAMTLLGVAGAAAITFTTVPVYRARTAIRLEEPDDYRNLSGVLPLAANAPTVPNEAWLQNELKVLES